MKLSKKIEAVSAFCLSKGIPCDISYFFSVDFSNLECFFVLRFGLSFTICTIDYLYDYVTKFKNQPYPSSVTLTYCLKKIITLKLS